MLSPIAFQSHIVWGPISPVQLPCAWRDWVWISFSLFSMLVVPFQFKVSLLGSLVPDCVSVPPNLLDVASILG